MASTSLDSESNMEIEKRLGRLECQLENAKILAAQGSARFILQGQPDTDEIDFLELFNVVWQGKWIIAAVTFVFAAISVLYALSLPNIYRSEALLAPAEENSGGGLAGLAGRFGGLASLAGVNLGSSGSDKTTLALEVLKSREFISKFVTKHDLFVPLMAAEGWSREGNKLILNKNIYDESNKKWIRETRPPRGAKPSLLEVYEQFTKLLTVSKDEKSGLVSVGVEFYSPILAKEWVDKLVLEINEEIRQRDVAEASKSIEYLSDQLAKISVADMKTVFYELIEEQTKTVMFAKVRDEYVFKTIDSAVVPELKAKPKKALIFIFGVLLGGMLGVFYVFVHQFIKNLKV